MIDIPGERATSAVQYANSLKAEMERLMIAGDVTDRDDKTAGSKISRAKKDPERVDRECAKAAEMLKDGFSITDTAKTLDVSVNALRGRLKRRDMIPEPKPAEPKTVPAFNPKEKGRPASILPKSIKRANQLRCQGYEWKDVGLMVGAKPDAIRMACKASRKKLIHKHCQ